MGESPPTFEELWNFPYSVQTSSSEFEQLFLDFSTKIEAPLLLPSGGISSWKEVTDFDYLSETRATPLQACEEERDQYENELLIALDLAEKLALRLTE